MRNGEWEKVESTLVEEEVRKVLQETPYVVILVRSAWVDMCALESMGSVVDRNISEFAQVSDLVTWAQVVEEENIVRSH